MNELVNEKLRQTNEGLPANEEASDKHGEAIQEQLHQQRDRRKRSSKVPMKRTGLQWSWELEARLLHYLADRTREECRDVDRSEVMAEALDEFLSRRDH